MKLLDYYKKAVTLTKQRNDTELILLGDAPNELFFINLALCDLNEDPSDNVLEERNLTRLKANALPYGIAYYLSVHNSDFEKSRFFSSIYTAKRNTALSEISKIKNIFNYRG